MKALLLLIRSLFNPPVVVVDIFGNDVITSADNMRIAVDIAKVAKL